MHWGLLRSAGLMRSAEKYMIQRLPNRPTVGAHSCMDWDVHAGLVGMASAVMAFFSVSE